MKKSALALVFAAAAVSAQSSQSVIQVLYPGADNLTLLGSIIASDATATTLVLACTTSDPNDDDLDSDACGLPEPITMTTGPKTLYLEESFESLSVALDCVVSGTTAALCKETFVGPAAYLETSTSAAPLSASTTESGDGITTTTITTVLPQSEMVYAQVSLTTDLTTSTAGTAASGSAATASATGFSGTLVAGSTASGSGSSAVSGAASRTASSGSATPSSDSGNTASRGDFRMLAWSTAGAGLLGLSILLL